MPSCIARPGYLDGYCKNMINLAQNWPMECGFACSCSTWPQSNAFVCKLAASNPATAKTNRLPCSCQVASQGLEHEGSPSSCCGHWLKPYESYGLHQLWLVCFFVLTCMHFAVCCTPFVLPLWGQFPFLGCFSLWYKLFRSQAWSGCDMCCLCDSSSLN